MCSPSYLEGSVVQWTQSMQPIMLLRVASKLRSDIPGMFGKVKSIVLTKVLSANAGQSVS